MPLAIRLPGAAPAPIAAPLSPPIKAGPPIAIAAKGNNTFGRITFLTTFLIFFPTDPITAYAP